MDDNFIKPD